MFIIAFMTTRKGETNEKFSNGELVSDNLVWLYNGIQCSFETVSFGRELSDLWNFNATLLNKKVSHQTIRIVFQLSVLNICIKIMLAVFISTLFSSSNFSSLWSPKFSTTIMNHLCSFGKPFIIDLIRAEPG